MLPLVMMRLVTSKSSEPSSDRARISPPTESPRSWVTSTTRSSPAASRHRLGGVGVAPDAVADVGLVGQTEAEEVEEHDPPARRPDRFDHAPPVERARREPVQDSNGSPDSGPIAGSVEHEHLEPVDRDALPSCFPVRDQLRSHVRDSRIQRARAPLAMRTTVNTKHTVTVTAFW